MSEFESQESGRPFPWGVLLTTAAVGALAFVLYRKVQDVGGISAKSVETALELCSKAAETLEHRLVGDSGDLSMAG
jgi:hypothetical protein